MTAARLRPRYRPLDAAGPILLDTGTIAGALLLAALGAFIRLEPAPGALQGSSAVAEAQGQALLVRAWDAYMGSIQDHREPEFTAAYAAEGARLYRELLARFPDGLPRKSLGPDADARSWRGTLFELEHLQVGDVAPALEARCENGAQASLADLRGRVALVYFQQGGSAEEGDLAELRQLELRARRGVPLAVLVLRREGEVPARRNPRAGLISAQAREARNRPFPSIWDIGILPASLVLDARGVIRYRALHGEELAQAVDVLLAQGVLPALLLSIR